MRAQTMAYFDQLIPSGMVMAKEAKEQGRNVVGYYCVFSPIELIEAAGAVPVGLCATKQEPIAEAEKVLPRNLCPLVKSSYGFAVSGKCPFFHFADIVLAETTCDGKKKMYELLAEHKPMIVLDIPNSSNLEDRQAHWVKQIYRAKDYFEKNLDVKISKEKLAEVIRAYNEERKLLMELVSLNKLHPTPISGTDLLKVLWGRSFQFKRDEYTAKVKELIAELKEMTAKGEGASTSQPSSKRILITGCPTGTGQEKVMQVIEEAGGAIVLQESCSGIKGLVDLVSEEMDPFEALAEKYSKIPCSCSSPNTGRFELLSRLVQEYKVDGVVDCTLQACHTYNIESYSIKEHLKKNHNIPLLQIETDYSDADRQQIKLRVDAFLEML